MTFVSLQELGHGLDIMIIMMLTLKPLVVKLLLKIMFGYVRDVSFYLG
jgi:hypothetical protein